MTNRAILLPALIAAADQAVKVYVRMQPPGNSFYELPGIVSFVHTRNTGAAFSILSGQAMLLAVITAAFLAALCLYLARQRTLTHAAEAAVLVLIGGGLGNLIDRILYSGVTDYIRLLLFNFPVFNLADIAVSGSIAVLIGLLLTGRLEILAGEKDESDH